MTTQEFVKKEKDKIVNELFHPATDYSESKLLAKQEFGNGIITGLTKGLEMLNEYAAWRIKRHDRNHILRTIEMLNDDELKELFLTEKYGK